MATVTDNTSNETLLLGLFNGDVNDSKTVLLERVQNAAECEVSGELIEGGHGALVSSLATDALSHRQTSTTTDLITSRASTRRLMPSSVEIA